MAAAVEVTDGDEVVGVAEAVGDAAVRRRILVLGFDECVGQGVGDRGLAMPAGSLREANECGIRQRFAQCSRLVSAG